MQGLAGESLNLKEYNLDKLKEIFPEVFCEDKIDFENLRLLLGDKVEDKEERYEFTWNGKSNAIRIAQTPSTGTLRPDKESSKNWDDTENLYIEGDNLEVLKLLQKSYFGKVKMIYIDPPYNTGKDFVYKDNFRDNIANYKKITNQSTKANPETNGRYHTDWLNMMYPRLKLARNLLRDDGVIFISIDEIEGFNLKKVCDEIFGEENFIECISWNKRIPKNDKGIGNIHEYILIYVKSNNNNHKFTMEKEGLDEINELLADLKIRGISIQDAEKELKKLYDRKGYDRGITLYNSLDKDYNAWGKINMSWPNSNTFGPRYDVLHPHTKKPVKVPDRGWRWKKETFNEYLDYENTIELYDGSFICGKIWFGKDENMQPSSIKYLNEVDTMLLKSILSLKSDGGIEVENLFNKKGYFAYPKPTTLIKYMINSLETKNDIILDFFSGSSATAHSVMKLNAEDNGNRKFIMVQLPEQTDEKGEAYKDGYKNICEIGKDRIRKAGDKIVSENKDKEKIKNLDIGFKVFKLDSSNLKSWDSSTENLEQNLLNMESNLKKDRTCEDLLYEILLKSGIDLTSKIEGIKVGYNNLYNIGCGALLACLDDKITQDVIDEIPKHKSPFMETKVIFKEAGFMSDDAKINAIQNLKQFKITDVRSV